MKERRPPNDPRQPARPGEPADEPIKEPVKEVLSTTLPPSHKNKSAWIMPAKPGQTVADLSHEERIRSARQHEHQWKQRTNRSTGGSQNF